LSLTASLMIQALLVRGLPIPKILVPLWNLSVANAPRALKIRQQMKADGWGFETTDYFVTMEMAPVLFVHSLIHKKHTQYTGKL
jgi:hypothetical protein